MFSIVIAVLAIITLILFLSQTCIASKVKLETNSNFQKLQRRYLIVYCLACFGDWIQGPYVYKLYKDYGYSEGEIAVLFIVGTISNSLFGTVTGVLADKYGRKTLCVLYGVLYSCCCVTKLFNIYKLLIVGRILGGVSTSILYSTFESWYINEHINHYMLPNEWLSNTFAKATFLNATLAILAGFLSYILVNVMQLGVVAPFIAALPFLTTTSACGILLLNEHYIYNTKSASASVKKAVVLWLTNKNIFILSVIQSLYEGVMYLFIFIWTPALDSIQPPLGLVFSSFMLALMIGSKIYSISLAHNYLDSKKMLLLSTFLASVSFFMCTMAVSKVLTNHSLYVIKMCYIFFVIYEISIGIYLPSMMYLKSQVIPENIRVTLSNVIKVPSNIFICLVLLWTHLNDVNQTTNVKTIFVVCLIATLITLIFSKIFSKIYKTTYKDVIIKPYETEI